MKKILTLCIIHKHPNIPLGFKKKGFGEGRWNGFGGKVEEGETVEEAARREVWEEAGIEVSDAKSVGTIDFEFVGEPETLEVHVFRATDYAGEPKETDEMRPAWFKIDEIPFFKMWPDDCRWPPLLLSGKKFRCRFLLEGHDKIVEKKMTIVRGEV